MTKAIIPAKIIHWIINRFTIVKETPNWSPTSIAIVSSTSPKGKDRPIFSVNEKETDKQLIKKNPDRKVRIIPIYNTISFIFLKG